AGSEIRSVRGGREISRRHEMSRRWDEGERPEWARRLTDRGARAAASAVSTGTGGPGNAVESGVAEPPREGGRRSPLAAGHGGCLLTGPGANRRNRHRAFGKEYRSDGRSERRPLMSPAGSPLVLETAVSAARMAGAEPISGSNSDYERRS